MDHEQQRTSPTTRVTYSDSPLHRSSRSNLAPALADPRLPPVGHHVLAIFVDQSFDDAQRHGIGLTIGSAIRSATPTALSGQRERNGGRTMCPTYSSTRASMMRNDMALASPSARPSDRPSELPSRDNEHPTVIKPSSR